MITLHPTPLTRLLRLALAALLILLALIPPAPAARAQSVVVRYAAPSAAGSGDCLSWESACTLQTALTGATIGTEIWVQRGVHFPGGLPSDTFRLKDLVMVYGGFAGDETDLSQRDPAANLTVLSGEIGLADDRIDNIHHVVTASGINIEATLDGFTITRGCAIDPETGNQGGGMHILNSSGLSLRNIHFLDNFGSFGGGLAIMGSSSPLLDAITFRRNSAGFGGGLYSAGSNVLMMNATFFDNHANSGGAIFNTSNAMLLNITLSENIATDYGGGIYDAMGGDGERLLLHSILWGNTAGQGAQMFSESGRARVWDSLVQGGCPPGSLACLEIRTTDPLLGELGDYGGTVETIPLLPGSPAIDAGSYENVLVTTDGRGVARPQGTAKDYGAYEARPFTLAKTGGDQQSALVGEAFAAPLAVRIGSDFGEPVDGGVVTFSAPASGPGATPLSAGQTIAGGMAALEVSANLVYGAYMVRAAAKGAPEGTFALTNNRSGSNTTLASSPGPSILGQGVTFIAAVSGAGGRQPGETVTFRDGTTILTGCAGVPVHEGRALCHTAALAHGAHTVQADFSGDVYLSPSSALLDHTVQARTLTGITSSLNPALGGQAVTLTITVSTVAPGSGVPTGTVRLYRRLPGNAGGAGEGALGAVQDEAAIPLVNGVAEITISSLPVGTHQLLAVYSGDATFAASESAHVSQVVDAWRFYLPVVWIP